MMVRTWLSIAVTAPPHNRVTKLKKQQLSNDEQKPYLRGIDGLIGGKGAKHCHSSRMIGKPCQCCKPYIAYSCS